MSQKAFASLTNAASLDSSRTSGLLASKGSSQPFSRFEPPKRSGTKPRSRASTLSNELTTESERQKENNVGDGDVFEREKEDDNPRAASLSAASGGASSAALPPDFDELPIELTSLADRFISSLTNAKFYASPPSAEKLSEVFQDFYGQAETSISIHIQALSTRQSREASPAPSMSSRASGRGGANLKNNGSKDSVVSPGAEQQLLTASEVSERKRARRLLAQKKVMLEEAVERRVSEAVYDKVWKHKSTMDDVQDEKLRSKTASLAIMGISLKELGIDLQDNLSTESQADIEESIAMARDALMEMNESKYPLGKLQSLASAHQQIVALLTRLRQSSSSADEVLPTLIYTLMASPLEGINAISNLRFIQRFRSQNRVDGEAAYCLTNLEAAITFLETVDVATLRSDEVQNVSRKPSPQPATLSLQAPDPSNLKSPNSPTMSSPATTPLTAVPTHVTGRSRSSSDVKPSPPASPSHQRRLSSLFGPPSSALEAAREAVSNTADQGIKTIGASLDNSFKVLFGRLRETHVSEGSQGADANGTVIVPKTLADAQRLISPKPALDEDGNISENSSFMDQDPETPREDRILNLISGTRKPLPQARDRSVDSNQSIASSRRVALAQEKASSTSVSDTAVASTSQSAAATLSPTPPSASSSAVDSMRAFGNTLNPLNRLGGMSMMRGFGRSSSATSAQTLKTAAASSPLAAELQQEQASTSTQELASSMPVQLDPPVQRYLEVRSAGELRLDEVEGLLSEYRRVVGVLKGMGIWIL